MNECIHDEEWFIELHDYCPVCEMEAELAALRARVEAVEALAKKWQNKNKYAADVVICGEELAATLKGETK